MNRLIMESYDFPCLLDESMSGEDIRPGLYLDDLQCSVIFSKTVMIQSQTSQKYRLC